MGQHAENEFENTYFGGNAPTAIVVGAVLISQGIPLPFTRTLPGTYAITVTASNAAGSLTTPSVIKIESPNYRVYLPLTRR